MKSLTGIAGTLLVVLGLALLIGPAEVCAEDLEEMLQEVGQEYAESYAAPFIHTFGPNMTSNLFSTASIPWHGFTFGIGVKVTAADLDEDDQTFRRVIKNVEFSEFFSGPLPSGFDDTGDLIISGPTIFGDTETNGTITYYSNGLSMSTEGISGLVDTKNVPMVVPEIYVGGFLGLKATLRYLPEMDLGDYGKTTFKGFGLQWSAKGLLPHLPVDFMAGFFRQQLDIDSLVEAKANTIFVGASKDFSVLTVYAGLAKEDSEMTITYEFEDLSEDISFTEEGVQTKRAILGATLGLSGMALNLEMAKGSIATYSAGLMFGI